MRTPAARGGLAGWQVKRIDAFTRMHLREATPARLAHEIRLSASYFGRAFRVTYGTTPRQWLIDRRVERARDLLQATNKPIGEVAAELGYTGAPQLARIFRRHTGLSPRNYRRS